MTKLKAAFVFLLLGILFCPMLAQAQTDSTIIFCRQPEVPGSRFVLIPYLKGGYLNKDDTDLLVSRINYMAGDVHKSFEVDGLSLSESQFADMCLETPDWEFKVGTFHLSFVDNDTTKPLSRIHFEQKIRCNWRIDGQKVPQHKRRETLSALDARSIKAIRYKRQFIGRNYLNIFIEQYPRPCKLGLRLKWFHSRLMRVIHWDTSVD